ncbi:hypothetical protein PCE1_000536 [Barthelona sp. PCE]
MTQMIFERNGWLIVGKRYFDLRSDNAVEIATGLGMFHEFWMDDLVCSVKNKDNITQLISFNEEGNVESIQSMVHDNIQIMDYKKGHILSTSMSNGGFTVHINGKEVICNERYNDCYSGACLAPSHDGSRMWAHVMTGHYYKVFDVLDKCKEIYSLNVSDDDSEVICVNMFDPSWSFYILTDVFIINFIDPNTKEATQWTLTDYESESKWYFVAEDLFLLGNCVYKLSMNGPELISKIYFGISYRTPVLLGGDGCFCIFPGDVQDDADEIEYEVFKENSGEIANEKRTLKFDDFEYLQLKPVTL